MSIKLRRWGIGAVGLIVLLVGFQIMFDAEDFLKTKVSSKKVEMLDSVIIGYDKSNKAWEIKANYIWGGANKYLFRVEELDYGRLFDPDGDVLLDEIKAYGVKVNSQTKTIVATNNITARFIKKGDASTANAITIRSKALKYYGFSKKTYLNDNVILQTGSTKVMTNEAVLDNETSIVTINPPFWIHAKGYTASANRMVIDINKDTSKLNGNVSILRKANRRTRDEREDRFSRLSTRLMTDALIHKRLADEDVMIFLSGNIDIRQPDKTLKGGAGKYQRSLKRFVLTQNVSLESDDLRWLFRNKRLAKLKNKKMRAAIGDPVKVTADKMVFLLDKSHLTLEGHIVIKQKTKTVRCDKLIFDDNKGEILLIGSVYIQMDDDDTIRSEYVRIDLPNEEVYFESQSEIEIEI